MGTEIGNTPADLAPRERADAALREDPHSFGFFEAVRLLQRFHPEREPVGDFASPRDEGVRFSVNPSLAFPASQIQELTLDGDGPARMEVNFMGLVGNESVLPHVYSRAALAERARDARPLTDFLDMFHHRLVSLAYRAWERSRFYVAFERGEDDWAQRRVFDLIGLRNASVRGKMAVRDAALAYYGGLLSMRCRSAAGLEQLLSDYFSVRVQVEQFVGAWYRVPVTLQCRIDDEPGMNDIGLGDGAVLGDEVWDAQSRVLLRIGPLTRAQYDDFLPNGSAHAALRSLTRFYSDGDLDFEVQLVLDRNEVAGIMLGAQAPADQATLGWHSWIRTAAFTRDADETTLTL